MEADGFVGMSIIRYLVYRPAERFAFVRAFGLSWNNFREIRLVLRDSSQCPGLALDSFPSVAAGVAANTRDILIFREAVIVDHGPRFQKCLQEFNKGRAGARCHPTRSAALLTVS